MHANEIVSPERGTASAHIKTPSLAAGKQPQWLAASMQGPPAPGTELPAGAHGCRAFQCTATPRPAYDASGLLVAITTTRQQPRAYGGPDGAQHVWGHGHGKRRILCRQRHTQHV